MIVQKVPNANKSYRSIVYVTPSGYLQNVISNKYNTCLNGAGLAVVDMHVK